MPLYAILQERAKHAPDGLFAHALSSAESISNLQAFDATNALLAWMEATGLKPKARIVLLSRNHWALYPLLVACAVRGAVLVPLDPNLHANELDSLLKHAKPSIILRGDELDAALKAGSARTVASARTNEPGTQGLLLIYTSGTTGGSKGVLLSERNLLQNAEALRGRYGTGETDRFLCVLPMFHMNALMITGVLPILSGASIFLGDLFGFTNAKFFWEDLAKHRITVCSLVPSIMAMLLKIARPGAKLPHSLRFGFCGAAPLPAELWREFETAFGVRIYQGYGLTETTCWAVSTPPDAERDYESVGTALAGTEIKISGRGEIQLGGPLLMRGYFRARELTRAQLTPEGLFKTGDIGSIDAPGGLRVTGRLKEIIIRNGSNISGRDVDSILLRHPSVLEAKTIGMPDPLVGERVHTACVLKPGAIDSSTELTAWLRGQISESKRPDAITIMGFLPKTPTGKIMLQRLRKILNGERCEEILVALGNRRWKRARESGRERIEGLLKKSLLAGEPMRFLAYWGCGGRDSIGTWDTSALDRLRAFVEEAKGVSDSPPSLTLVLTDLHAANNGIPKARIERYFSEISRDSERRGFHAVLLSEVWRKAGLAPELLAPEADRPAFLEEWNCLSLREKLIEQARRHSEDPVAHELSARRYFRACLWDRQAIGSQFPGHIFLTYNSPETAPLLPDLPTMYLFSFKEGTSVKPWFAPGLRAA